MQFARAAVLALSCTAFFARAAGPEAEMPARNVRLHVD